MFFRFAASLVLIVMVSMAGVQLEKRTLELRRAVSRQYYQTDLLIEQQVQLRLETQRLTAPAQLEAFESFHSGHPNAVRTTPVTGALPSVSASTRLSDRSLPTASSASGAARTSAHRDPAAAAPGSSAGMRLPLLRFQYPLRPEGID